MAVNKIEIKGSGQVYVPIDLTQDTVTANDVMPGKTFHLPNGEQVTGESSAIIPEGTFNITRNDIYNIAQYENVNVNVDGSSKAIIRVAELPEVSLTLSSSGVDIETQTTPQETGGIVEFWVNRSGEYTITATGVNITSWTRTVTVKEINTIVECKAGVLANYTPAQIHLICQNGYFSNMFSIKDEYVLNASGSFLDNQKIFVEDIVKENGREMIDWRANKVVTIGSYMMNNRICYLSTSSSTSWVDSSFGFGGMKYSTLRQTMMKQGEEVYSQATGIIPDSHSRTITGGVKFSDLKYTNGEACPIYSYDCDTDVLTLLSDGIYTPNKNSSMIIKGYFHNVGTLDSATFNSGVYYTYSDYLYTKATSYNSGITYYGLYETLQEDGIFVGEIFKTNLSDYLVKREVSASAGGNQTTTLNSFADYFILPSIEEITGLNRTMTLPSGIGAGNANFLVCKNLEGEGTYKPAYDYAHIQGGIVPYYTRSIYENDSLKINETNGVTSTRVSNNYYIRPGFRTN